MIVVADTAEEQATWPKLGADADGGRGEVGVGERVGQGVVTAEDDVEGARDGVGEGAQVGDAEGDASAQGGGLAAGVLDGGRSEVGRVDGVAAQGQADRLGADAAGAIEDAQGGVAELGAEDAVEDVGLTLDRAVPVSEDQMVVGGEFVVEARDWVRHSTSG